MQIKYNHEYITNMYEFSYLTKNQREEISYDLPLKCLLDQTKLEEFTVYYDGTIDLVCHTALVSHSAVILA